MNVYHFFSGETTYLYVIVPYPASLVRVQFKNAVGSVIFEIPASTPAGQAGDAIALQPFVPPSESFFVKFVGTVNGSAFEELTTTMVTPVPRMFRKKKLSNSLHLLKGVISQTS